eukprot:2090729-Pyramimonas_sp.AAC.1
MIRSPDSGNGLRNVRPRQLSRAALPSASTVNLPMREDAQATGQGWRARSSPKSISRSPSRALFN